MPLITPRRRFLITAPLALLLPAGLLTYLGLETVKGVDIQYELLAREKVNGIITSVRNSTSNRVIYTIQKPFHDAFVVEGIKQFDEFPLPDGWAFHLNDALPAANLLFVYGSDRNLYFFRRKSNSLPRDQEANKITTNGIYTEWILSSSEFIFAGQLKSAIESALETNTDSVQPNIQLINTFRTLHYPPMETYPIDGKRELIFYTILNESPPLGKTTRIQAIGLTVDFDYINTIFFNSLLSDFSSRLPEMWPELQHPIAIEDNLLQIRVASMNGPNDAPMTESLKYRPEIFHNEFFPWYRLHFSTTIGEELMEYANNLKIFYFCLIATANVVMIASLIGALRNISKELALSDLRSNFVARVSHELRTPLGLIRLYSETLEMNRAKTDEKRKEYLHAITKESERLTHMINNILNFSRIEANSQHYTFTMDNLESIVLETVDTMRYHFERHGLEILVSIEDDIPQVRCDAEALQQALYNLMNNAMKYTGDGKAVEVRAYRNDGEAIVSVTDRGIGIALDQQEKIFAEFYRVDDPQVRETGGSGLGLAVVKHIVEAHHGSITVQSKLRQGSTFAIHIPIPKETKANGD